MAPFLRRRAAAPLAAALVLGVIFALHRRRPAKPLPPDQIPVLPNRSEILAAQKAAEGNENIARAHALAGRINQARLPFPVERYPKKFMYGWAARTFAYSPRDRVAYLLMPKAGSSSIRAVMIREYGLKPRSYADGLTAKGSLRDVDRVEAYQPGVDVRSLHSFYKFTFVTDPANHFVAGVCEANPGKCNFAIKVVRAGRESGSWPPVQGQPLGRGWFRGAPAAMNHRGWRGAAPHTSRLACSEGSCGGPQACFPHAAPGLPHSRGRAWQPQQ